MGKSDGWPDLKLKKKALAVADALTGEFDGSVPFILDMVLKFPGDGTVDFDQNVKVASTEIKCPTEKIAETDSEISFPEAPNDGDCMGDALRGQGKDVTKFVISKDSATQLSFRSDGWSDLKLKMEALAVADALTGEFDGSVPFILDM